MVKSNLFLKLFPPPQYLEQPVLGLDLSDRSIKFCQLALGWNGLHIKRFGEREVAVGILEVGRIKQPDQLIALLRALKQELGLEAIVASLPEEPAYMVRLELPAMRRSELRGSIELQLEEYIPLPPSAVVFDYEVIQAPEKESGHWSVLVSVMPKEVVEEYDRVFRAAGWQPVSLEIEAQAIVRSLIAPDDKQTALVVDFGKTRTSLFVASGQQVLFTSTVANIGGEAISRSIQKNLELDYPAAEQLKQVQGLLHSPTDNRLLVAIVPLVAALRDEIGKIYGYWGTRPGQAKADQPPISRVILCGGQSQLPGLIEYLSLSLDLEVRLGNIWTNVLDTTMVVPPINAIKSLSYATSLGLALKHYQHFASHD